MFAPPINHGEIVLWYATPDEL